eukprot:4594691-Pyramimonas_sp.AAC.1
MCHTPRLIASSTVTNVSHQMLPHVHGELRSRALDVLVIAVEHVPALPKWLQQPFPELLQHQ